MIKFQRNCIDHDFLFLRCKKIKLQKASKVRYCNNKNIQIRPDFYMQNAKITKLGFKLLLLGVEGGHKIGISLSLCGAAFKW